jgi:hypothetical protein
VAPHLKIENGLAVAPDTPGHGLTFDWRGLELVKA